MRHYLFTGETVHLRDRIYAGEVLPYSQQPDGTGFDLYIGRGDEVTVIGSNGDQLEIEWSSEDGSIVDVDILVKPDQFDHECNCADYSDDDPGWQDWTFSWS